MALTGVDEALDECARILDRARSQESPSGGLHDARRGAASGIIGGACGFICSSSADRRRYSGLNVV